MRLSRSLGMFAVSIVIALSLGLGLAAPAEAAGLADPLDVSDITHLDFETPRNAAAYKTTVPASVLRAAAKVRAARGSATFTAQEPKVLAKNTAGLAAASRQTRAAAALSRTNGPSVKDWTAAQKTAPKVQAAMASVKSKFRVPSTSLSTLGKVAGTAGKAVAVLSAAEIGFNAGHGISDILGISNDGEVCRADNGTGILATVAGVDCENFYALNAEYVPNTDATIGQPGQIWCADIAASHICYRMAPPYIGPNPDWWYLDMSGTATPVTNAAGTVYARSGPSGTWQYLGPVRIGTQCGAGVAADVVCSGEGAGYWGLPSSGPKPTQFCTVYQAGGECAGEISTPEPSAVADPVRTLQCDVTGSDGVVRSSTSETFTEGGDSIAPPECPGLPDGVSASNYKIFENGGPTPLVLADEPTTPEYQAWATQYAECTSGLCYADLRKVVPGSATGTLSCFDDLTDADCLDWYTAPNKADVFQCWYAGAVTTLDECNHYAPTFDSSKRAAGQAYADPTTGTAAPVASAPANDGTFGGPVRDPEKTRSCFPTGWAALNPVEWVVRPVGCALEDAFVPRKSVLDARLAGLDARWKTTQPAKLIVAVGAVAPALSTLEDGGCGGIPIDLSGIGGGIIPAASGKFLPACSGDFFYPWAIGIKIFLVGAISIGGFFGIKQQVSQLVGLSGSA